LQKLEKIDSLFFGAKQTLLDAARHTQKKLQAMQHDSKISYFIDDYFSDEK
jgi:hypothetical protein